MRFWQASVRSGIRKELGQTSALEQNLLGVPLFALHSRAATQQSSITRCWKSRDGGDASFTFSRIAEKPFPLPIHAKVLDAMIASFANNLNSSGLLYFKMSDIARSCGLTPGPSSRRVILEAIKRYQQSHVSWHFAFEGRAETWSGSIIEYSSLTDPKFRGRNPRRSNQTENWHNVKFHTLIRESIANRKIRILLTDAIKQLPPDAYVLYRFLRRWSDQSVIRRSLDDLKNAVNSQEKRFDKFKIWLESKFKQLLEAGFIESYAIHPTHATVKVVDLKTQLRERKFRLTQQTLADVIDSDDSSESSLSDILQPL